MCVNVCVCVCVSVSFTAAYECESTVSTLLCVCVCVFVCVSPHLLPGRTAVGQQHAAVLQALVGPLVLVEDLLRCQAALEHLHLLLLLQRHLQPLLCRQHLLLQRRLLLLWGHKGHGVTRSGVVRHRSETQFKGLQIFMMGVQGRKHRGQE